MCEPFNSVPAIVPREALAYLNDAADLLGKALPYAVFLACENCDTTIELGDIGSLPFEVRERIEDAVQEVNWALSRNSPLVIRPTKSGRLEMFVPGC
ncbi:MAG: hypothetical protein ACK41U_10445 [Paracoccus sp. (in: a-proteobacteria)]|uniref:hypothetical protein n=1 Tax=Paracoccus sp. TaxID=267 RepID=UPI00391CA2D9